MRDRIESQVRSAFLAGYTLSEAHRPYDGEADRGESAAWHEYRKGFDPVDRILALTGGTEPDMPPHPFDDPVLKAKAERGECICHDTDTIICPIHFPDMMPLATPAGTEPDTLLKKLEAEIETWQSPYEGEDETSIVQWSDVLAVFATPAAEPTLPILHEQDESGNWICCCGDHLVAEEPSAEPQTCLKDFPPVGYCDCPKCEPTPTGGDALADEKAWKRTEQDLLLLLRKELLDPEKNYDDNMRDILSTLRAKLRERRTTGFPEVTPEDVAEMTPEWWAGCLEQARDDMMTAEDYEPCDIAHIMTCAAVALRTAGERKTPDGWIGNGVYLTEHGGTMKSWAKDGMSLRPFVYIVTENGGGS